jgi:hypothetical protein
MVMGSTAYYMVFACSLVSAIYFGYFAVGYFVERGAFCAFAAIVSALWFLVSAIMFLICGVVG